MPPSHRQHDLSEMLVRAHMGMRFDRLIEREAAIHRQRQLAHVLDRNAFSQGRAAERAVLALEHVPKRGIERRLCADDLDRGAPSFVTEPPGTQIKADPSRLAIYKDNGWTESTQT